MMKLFKLRNLTEKYLSEITYGSIDGIVTTFAVIAASEGAHFSRKIILILGFANVIADGFSMSVGCYFSSRNSFGVAWISHKTCIRNAFVTFTAFVISGTIPLLLYIFDTEKAFLISSILTGIVFLLIGSLKGLLYNKDIRWQATQTLIFGSAACALSYFAGMILKIFV